MKKYIKIIVLPLVFLIIAELLPIEWLKEHKLYSRIGIGISILVIIFILEVSRRKKERKEEIERLKALEEEKRKALEEEERKRVEALSAQYTFIGKSSSLTPEKAWEGEAVRIGLFKDYYYRRLTNEDDKLKECLKNKKNLLIIGPPLIGKTRAVYEALKNLNEPQDVIIPRCADIEPDKFLLPETQIILINDLHRFVDMQNFEYLLNESIKNKITIIATCQSAEMEYNKVQNRIKDLELIFEKIELPRVSKEAGKEIAARINKPWDKAEKEFDGTPGSILLPLEEIKRRFNARPEKGGCSEEERAILCVLRSLYICGIYEERQVFPLQWIKIATEKVGLKGEDYKWTHNWLKGLKDKELITLEKEYNVRVEEVYLKTIFIPPVPVEKEILDAFEEMITTFSGVPKALFRLGYRANDIGNIDLEKARYKKIAIKAYNEALKVRTLDRFPMQYAMTQNNLGNAFRTLAEVEDKVENCKQAIKAYEEALKVYTLARFPMQYAGTQNNLGNAFRTLAEVEDKAGNCKQAIRACEEALKVRTLDRFPMDYATTQNNLGTAFRTLAEVEDKVGNCKRAFNAYMEALKVFKKEGLTEPCRLVEGNLKRLRDYCGGHTR